FDIKIPLQKPFRYDPAAGNLLIDFRNFSGSGASDVAGAEAFGGGNDGGSRAVATNVPATVASFVNSGVDALQVIFEPLVAHEQSLSAVIGQWRAEGDASDSKGQNDGIPIRVGFVPGKIGQAFQFNGSNAFVRVPSRPSLEPTGPFTLAAWVKYDRL